MLKRIFICLLFVIFLLSPSVYAITWQEAVKLAEKNSYELESSKKELESSEWTYRKAFSAFLPQLSGSISMTETLSPTSAATSKSYSYGLSATQYIFRGTEGIFGIQSARADVKYKKANLDSTKALVLYTVREAFVGLLITQEKEKLLGKILDQRKENTRMIELRYESGKEDKGNLMRTGADQAQSEYDLSSARRDLSLAQLKISQLLTVGINKVSESKREFKFEETNYNALLQEAPSYLMAKQQLKTYELNQKKSISGFLPSFYLSGSYKKRGAEWPPETVNKSWSATLSIPIFSGGSNLADRAIAGAQLSQAQKDFAKIINDLRYELEKNFNSFADAVAALDVSRISLAAAAVRARIAKAKYLNGLMGYDEWDRMEKAYTQAQESLLSRKKSALLAEALWHKTYGGHIK